MSAGTAAAGSSEPDHAGEPNIRVLGELGELPEILSRERADELILAEEDLDEQRILEIVETAHRSGVRVRLAPKTTELLVQRGEYVPGQGAPLFELRPPVLAGADWAVKRTFDASVTTDRRERRQPTRDLRVLGGGGRESNPPDGDRPSRPL